MEGIVFLSGNHELLDQVKPLWEKLNEHHKENAKHFKVRYENYSFNLRRAGLLEKVQSGSEMRINLARCTRENKTVGYCISTVNKDHLGEIESIYIGEAFQGKGLGNEFVLEALKWMEAMEVKRKIVRVAAGNEQMFPFYSKYGFYPMITVLEQK